LGSNFAILPHLSPTPYRLFVLLLHSTPLSFLPYLFLTYFLSYLLRGLSPAYPLPSLSSSILKTIIYLFFPFGTMSIPTERTSYSTSFLFWPAHFMIFGFLFFLFLTPQTSTLSAFLSIPLSSFSPFPIHFPYLSSKCVFLLTLRTHVPLLLVFLFSLMKIVQHSFTPLLAMPDEALTLFSFLNTK
jgi:hypothetical protein